MGIADAIMPKVPLCGKGGSSPLERLGGVLLAA
jgi:hypothetical protein